MFKKLGKLFCPECFSFGSGPVCEAHTPGGEWAARIKQSYGDTPDDLIAAHIIESFATDFDGWIKSPGNLISNKIEIIWQNTTNECIGIGRGYSEYRYIHKRWGGQRATNGLYYKKCSTIKRHTGFTINSIPFDDKIGTKLVEAYIKLLEEYNTAKLIADKAKAKMEANEKKWNLAETLLGMKRLPTGALVPANESEERRR